jgi:hypothetical protein
LNPPLHVPVDVGFRRFRQGDCMLLIGGRVGRLRGGLRVAL